MECLKKARNPNPTWPRNPERITFTNFWLIFNSLRSLLPAAFRTQSCSPWRPAKEGVPVRRNPRSTTVVNGLMAAAAMAAAYFAGRSDEREALARRGRLSWGGGLVAGAG